MASVNNTTFEINTTRVETNNSFIKLLRPRHFFGKYIVVGRYYIAAMLFILNTISTWRFASIPLSIYDASHDDNHFFSPAVKNWTLEDCQTFMHRILGARIFVQIPAALLIYRTSSHKFLTAAVAVSSIFNILMPIVGKLHSSCIMITLFAHYIVEAPLGIAVLSIWKDWAPPGRQTIFVFISFSSLILGRYVILIINSVTSVIATQRSFYLSGACGIIWSLVWFWTITESPENNPQCPQNEQSCLENNTLSAVKNRFKLTDVPWKKILMSKPVYALCLIYFKIGGSSSILYIMCIIFTLLLQWDVNMKYDTLYIRFSVLYTVILFISAIITDIQNRKQRTTNINVKDRRMMCAVMVLLMHGLTLGILLSTQYSHIFLRTFILCVSYLTFSISIPGFMTNALELSTKYVVIIGGFIETFYHLGVFVGQYYMIEIYNYMVKHNVENQEGKSLLYEVFVAIFVAVIFQSWGSLEEQPWSLNTASSHTPANTETTSEEHERMVPSNS